jgi:hypothetical protein
MPTDKFESMVEALRSSLKIPYWLAANTTWYVDPVNGSDTITTIIDKGKSFETAFKTLNAAAQFVCSYFNFANRIATIKLAAGTYPALTIPKYNSTTGYLTLSGDPNGGTLVERLSGSGSCIVPLLTAGRINIEYINMRHVVDDSGTSSTGKYCLQTTAGTQIYLSNCTLTLVETADSIGSKNIIRGRAGEITINENVTLVGQSTKGSSSTISAIYLQISSLCSQNYDLTINGQFANALIAETFGYFARSTLLPIVTTAGMTGRSYQLSSFSRVLVRGAGEGYFPGTAGTIRANIQYE